MAMAMAMAEAEAEAAAVEVTAMEDGGAAAVEPFGEQCGDGGAAICGGEDSGTEAGEGRQWAEMLPDALARIFAILPLEERMLQVPLVCKTWRRAAMDPACWRAVDLHEWSRLMQWEVIHRMVELVVERSAGQLEELSVCRLMSDEPVDYIARRGHALKVLRIPFCQVTDTCISNIALSLHTVTHLDISGCTLLSKVALAQIGQLCRSLTRLDRNMSFFQTNSLQPEEYDDEALAISKHMPFLRHLELCYGSLSNKGLLAILDNCKQLGFLDLRGCMNLEIEGSVAERCRKLHVVYKHKFSDQFEMLEDLDDDLSDLPDDAFSDDGWDIEEWYSSSDEIEDCFPVDVW